MGIVFFAFLGVLAVCKMDMDLTLKRFISTALITITGYFSSSFQSKAAGISASHTPNEISKFNLGTGICGLFSNLIAIAATMIFKTDPSKKLENRE